MTIHAGGAGMLCDTQPCDGTEMAEPCREEDWMRGEYVNQEEENTDMGYGTGYPVFVAHGIFGGFDRGPVTV